MAPGDVTIVSSSDDDADEVAIELSIDAAILPRGNLPLSTLFENESPAKLASILPAFNLKSTDAVGVYFLAIRTGQWSFVECVQQNTHNFAGKPEARLIFEHALGLDMLAICAKMLETKFYCFAPGYLLRAACVVARFDRAGAVQFLFDAAAAAQVPAAEITAAYKAGFARAARSGSAAALKLFALGFRDNVVNAAMAELRTQFVAALYNTVRSGNVEALKELREMWPKTIVIEAELALNVYKTVAVGADRVAEFLVSWMNVSSAARAAVLQPLTPDKSRVATSAASAASAAASAR